MEELVRQYAGPVALALVIGYLSRYVEPRSRVVHWFAVPSFQFQVPVPGGQPVAIWTHQLSIQNVGYRAAKAVEIIHKQKPQNFQIQPAVKFTESTNTTGEHVISIDSLARGEFVAIQILGIRAQPPNLLGIKSVDGPSHFTKTGLHFVLSKPRLWVLRVFVVVGFVTTLSWVARMVVRYGLMVFAH